MKPCLACSHPTSEDSRFCPSCGASQAPSSQPPTKVHPFPGTAGASPGAVPLVFPSYRTAGIHSSGPLGGARFIPGAMLAGRYRVVGLLGKGGMGEVYRAEDLKLGQAVALKFLPESLARDENLLTRFFQEVRIARQVTHPNVCRVYDIGEVDGHHFLTMEYVDGEDLSSLLRRIGRLPKDKAIQIARQLCAGLAAAHDQGILHRDLKPANMMIDGRGRVRITDFGLAGLAEGIEGEEILAGTPAYMAPEQLVGEAVSVRSDIYSLGLSLYELFTGKQAFPANSSAELTKLQETTPASPSSQVEGFDPAVERIIFRCLEKDPARRPASALAVAAALPGGDPLAAALAAGETPSPEMVAEAGAEGALRPAIGFALVVFTIAGFVGLNLFAGKKNLINRVPLSKPPQALKVEARELIEKLGYPDAPRDTYFNFAYDGDFLQKAGKPDGDPATWDRIESIQPPPIYFYYRESPRYLVPTNWVFNVSETNPPVIISGMVNLRLAPDGRLLFFQAIPPQVDEEEGPGSAPDWNPVLEAAGLDPMDLQISTPTWNPLAGQDRRAAWTGHYPGQDDIEIRAEAASYRGKLVFFRVIFPWTDPGRMQEQDVPAGQAALNITLLVLLGAILVGGSLLARRNLRLGRGDRRGAFRLAVLVFFQVNAVIFLLGHHTPTLPEAGLAFRTISHALFFAGIFWIVYLAVEPYARRLWPEMLISWTRLLDGRFRDPRVGRDILIGGGTAMIVGIAFIGFAFWKVSAGWDPPHPIQGELFILKGMLQATGILLDYSIGMLVPMLLLLILLLFRVILRRQWAAVGGFFLLLTAVGLLQSQDPEVDWVLSVLVNCSFLFLLIRFGLLSIMAFNLFFTFSLSIPFTTDFSLWYSGHAILLLTVPLALAVYAFYISLAGRPVFKDMLAQE